MYKYTKVHVPECIDFWGTCACWYHFVFTYTEVCRCVHCVAAIYSIYLKFFIYLYRTRLLV